MKAMLALLVFIIAVAGMFLFVQSEPVIDTSYGLPLVVGGILAIIIFSWIGLFVRSIITYVLLSTVIQASYFILDAGSAILVGKSLWFAVLQALNFTIAGGLFMLGFALLYFNMKKQDLVDYAGIYEKNKFLVLAISVSCLSLGGMAGFNIYVGEFLLYSFLFAIHPALALSAIFAGLVCFLFYFRICYTLMVRKSDASLSFPLPLKLAAAALTILVVVLGVVPHILFGVLEVFA